MFLCWPPGAEAFLLGSVRRSSLQARNAKSSAQEMKAVAIAGAVLVLFLPFYMLRWHAVER